MALNDAGQKVAGDGVAAAITHVQAHSAASGPGYTLNLVGARKPVTWTVDADGDITTSVAYTGLPANQPIAEFSYWSALTAGVNYGGGATSGDVAANAAGEYNATITENNTST